MVDSNNCCIFVIEKENNIMANKITDLDIEIYKKVETYHKRSESAKKGWETRRLKKYLNSKEI